MEFSTLAFTFYIFQFLSGIGNGADVTFYLRHHLGKCLAFDPSKGQLIFQTICSQKFRWESGARLIHVQTNKCMLPVSASDGSVVSISDECSGTGSLFQYNHHSKILQHLITGFYPQPGSGTSDPAENETLVFKQESVFGANRFYFVPVAYYVIRQLTSTFCWVFNKPNDRFELRNTYVCDRFEYVNSKHLRHVATGKCVQAKSGGQLTVAAVRFERSTQ